MEQFKKELKELLAKHNAAISVEQEENDSFLYLQLIVNGESFTVDTGYRDLLITANSYK